MLEYAAWYINIQDSVNELSRGSMLSLVVKALVADHLANTLLGKSSPTISLEGIRVCEFPFDHKLPFRMRCSMCYSEIVCVPIPTRHAKRRPPRHHNGRGFLFFKLRMMECQSPSI